MDWIIEELNLDRTAHATRFQQDWVLAKVRTITFDGSDVGWLQVTQADDDLSVEQIVVDGRYQRRGIGTEVMNRLIRDAEDVNQPICPSVAKINPALLLYQRLGFHIVGEDDRKFYMKRDPGIVPSSSN